MPIHDWTKVPPGDFHDFHQRLSSIIADVLNERLLPPGYGAQVERRDFRGEGDDSTFSNQQPPGPGASSSVIATRPHTTHRQIRKNDLDYYAAKANRIKVLNRRRRLVSVIEIVSPGNKASRMKFREFRRKCLRYLSRGVCLLVIDIFPTTRRDPNGIHNALWKELWDEPYTLPPGKDRCMVSYAINGDLEAFIEPVQTGQALPDMPLFLASNRHILLPLEETYNTCWSRTTSLTKELFGVERPS